MPLIPLAGLPLHALLSDNAVALGGLVLLFTLPIFGTLSIFSLATLHVPSILSFPTTSIGALPLLTSVSLTLSIIRALGLGFAGLSLQLITALNNLGILNGKLNNEALLLVPVFGILGRRRNCHGVAVQPAQTHQRVTVGEELDESVATTATATAFLGDLGTLASLEDDLGLAHNTHLLLFAELLKLLHRVAGSLLLLF